MKEGLPSFFPFPLLPVPPLEPSDFASTSRLSWDFWIHGLGLWGGICSRCWERVKPENYLQLNTCFGNMSLLRCLSLSPAERWPASTLGEQLWVAVVWGSRAGEAGGHASEGNQARGENVGWWLGTGDGGGKTKWVPMERHELESEEPCWRVWRLGPDSDCVARGD